MYIFIYKTQRINNPKSESETKRSKKELAHNTNNKAWNKSQNHSVSGFVKHNSTGNIIAFKWCSSSIIARLFIFFLIQHNVCVFRGIIHVSVKLHLLAVLKRISERLVVAKPFAKLYYRRLVGRKINEWLVL